MFRRVLLTIAVILGIIVLSSEPLQAKESVYRVQHTGWRSGFREEGVRDNVFKNRLRIREEKRTLRQYRRSEVFPHYAYQESYSVSLIIVTNVSRASLYHDSSGPNEDAIYHPFDFFEELRGSVWVPTAFSFCGTGVSEHELKPGQSVAFYRGTPSHTPKRELRQRQWVVFSDKSRLVREKGRRTESLTLLSDSGGP